METKNLLSTRRAANTLFLGDIFMSRVMTLKLFRNVVVLVHNLLYAYGMHAFQNGTLFKPSHRSK